MAKSVKRKKSDSTEINNRVTFVYGLLLQGYQRKSIVQYTTEKYNVQERQIDVYLKKARSIFEKDNQIDIGVKKSEIISQLYHLYQQNYDIEDFKECKNVLKEIADIIGVKAAKVHVLEGNPDKPLEMIKPQIIIKERDK